MWFQFSRKVYIISDLRNCWPLSLTSTVCKVLGSIIRESVNYSAWFLPKQLCVSQLLISNIVLMKSKLRKPLIKLLMRDFRKSWKHMELWANFWIGYTPHDQGQKIESCRKSTCIHSLLYITRLCFGTCFFFLIIIHQWLIP